MNEDILRTYPVQVENIDVKDRVVHWGEENLPPEAQIPVGLWHQHEKIGVLHDVIKTQDQRADRPRRREGNVILAELDSFIAYVNRHKEARSVIFAEPKGQSVTCYFDYHDAGAEQSKAGWCQFTADYDCPTAPEWETWCMYNETWMPSADFAEFLDMNMQDLTTGEGYPAPVEVLEMARDLKIHTKGLFSKQVNATTGTYEMVAKQEHSQGSTKIHPKFQLALRVFQGGAQYAIEARTQLRIRDNTPELRYVLYRKDEFILDAFKDVHAKVAEETSLPVFVGRKDPR